MRYNLHMRILGVETSCDETAVCIIEAEGEFGSGFGFRVLGEALASQAALHARWGGVFPNLAKREHAKNLVPLLEDALRQAVMLPKSPQPQTLQGLSFEALLAREPELLARLGAFLQAHARPGIDCIAVTHGPGLAPALWVGVNFAKALSLAWKIPVVAVNHMEGHIVMPMMEMRSRSSGRLARFDFPALALLVSGGHTELVLSREWMRYELVGQTRDDAAGETFDKVARLLGLPYPGGPEISRLALEARSSKLEAGFKLPRPMLHEDNFDFSFAGLKTAARRVVERQYQGGTSASKMRIAREFEDAVADVLAAKTLRAAGEFGANTLILGGGVSANAHLRAEFLRRLEGEGNPAQLLFSAPELATDNALMIALAGYFRAAKNEYAGLSDLAARGDLKLA